MQSSSNWYQVHWKVNDAYCDPHSNLKQQRHRAKISTDNFKWNSKNNFQLFERRNRKTNRWEKQKADHSFLDSVSWLLEHRFICFSSSLITWAPVQSPHKMRFRFRKRPHVWPSSLHTSLTQFQNPILPTLALDLSHKLDICTCLFLIST